MKEETELRGSGLGRTVGTISPRGRNKPVRRKMGAESAHTAFLGITHREQEPGSQTEGPGAPSLRAARPSFIPSRGQVGAQERPRGRAQTGLAGLNGAAPSTQLPRPHRVSPQACGQHRGEAAALSTPSMQQPSSGHKTRSKHQQTGRTKLPGYQSALPPHWSSSPRLSLQEPGSPETDPAQRPLPGQSVGGRQRKGCSKSMGRRGH